MSDYKHHITDSDISNMLRQRLLQQADDPVTKILTEMEAKLVFEAMPVMAIPAQAEQQLISKLQHGIGRAARFKWWITGCIATAAVAGTIAISQNNHTAVSGSIASSAITTPAGQQQQLQSTPLGDTSMPVIHTEKQMETSVTGFPEDEPADAKINPRTLKPLPGQLLYWDPAKQEPLDIPFSVKPAKHNPAAAPSDQIENIITDTAFSGIKSVEVITFCNVNVNAVPGNNVTVKGQMTIETRGIAIKRSDYHFRYERINETLKIYTENTRKNDVLIAGMLQFKGNINITMPAETDIIVKNSSGDVSLSGMKGKICNAESTYGNIKAENIGTNINIVCNSGYVGMTNIHGNITCKNAYGNGTFDDISGALDCNFSSGDVSINMITGPVRIANHYGDISLTHAMGDVELQASSGDISLNDMTGATCNIKDNYGNVYASNVQAPVTVVSKSGDITLTDITGNTTATSSYGKQLLRNISGDLNISSSSGDVSVENLKGNLRIASVYGNVSLSRCHGSLDISARSGNINGRDIDVQEKLQVNTGYGNIHMQLNNDMKDLSFDLTTNNGSLLVNKGGTKSTGKEGRLQIQGGQIMVKGVSTSGNQRFE